MLLEIVNYIEHDGLQRQLVGDTGSRETRRPEPFGTMHAWNADHMVSNSMLPPVWFVVMHKRLENGARRPW